MKHSSDPFTCSFSSQIWFIVLDSAVSFTNSIKRFFYRSTIYYNFSLPSSIYRFCTFDWWWFIVMKDISRMEILLTLEAWWGALQTESQMGSLCWAEKSTFWLRTSWASTACMVAWLDLINSIGTLTLMEQLFIWHMYHLMSTKVIPELFWWQLSANFPMTIRFRWNFQL